MSYKLFPPCRVCGDESIGFHYGAYACLACKAFFKRHLKMDNHTLICSQGNGLCQVEGYSKRKCAFCRLQCCHRVGMSKAAVRTGRYSKQRHASILSEVHVAVRCHYKDPHSTELSQVHNSLQGTRLTSTVTVPSYILDYSEATMPSCSQASNEWEQIDGGVDCKNDAAYNGQIHSSESRYFETKNVTSIEVGAPNIGNDRASMEPEHFDLTHLPTVVIPKSHDRLIPSSTITDACKCLPQTVRPINTIPISSYNFTDQMDFEVKPCTVKNAMTNACKYSMIDDRKQYLSDEEPINIVDLTDKQNECALLKRQTPRKDFEMLQKTATTNEWSLPYIKEKSDYSLRREYDRNIRQMELDDVVKLYHAIDDEFDNFQYIGQELNKNEEIAGVLTRSVDEFLDWETYFDETKMTNLQEKYHVDFWSKHEEGVDNMRDELNEAKDFSYNNDAERLVKGFVDTAHSIPAFGFLSIEDRRILLKAALFETWMCFHYPCYSLDLKVVVTSYFSAHKSHMIRFLDEEATELMWNAAKCLQKLRLKKDFLPIFWSLALLDPDRHGLTDTTTIRRLRKNMINCLEYLFRQKEENPDEYLHQVHKAIWELKAYSKMFFELCPASAD